MNDVLRLVFIGLLMYSLLVLWQRWEQWPANVDARQNAPAAAGVAAPAGDAGFVEDDDAPPTATQQLSVADNNPETTTERGNDNIIRVSTDWLEAGISEQGGNLVSLRLKKHVEDNGEPFALFETGVRKHGAQSGLIGGDNLPDHRSIFVRRNPAQPTVLGDADSLTVALAASSGDVTLIKRYIFRRSDYVIGLEMESRNNGTTAVSPMGYFQLSHNGVQGPQESSFLPTFFGAVTFTDAAKFDKVTFDDIGNEPFPGKSNDGWIGLIQRYFAAVWLPEDTVEREYFMRQNSSGARVGVIVAFGEIAPGSGKSLSMRLFAGAQEQNILNSLNENGDAPGLHLVVDYGWLTVIAVLLFKLLAFIQHYVTNWGLSVILLTFTIKLAFYPLASISYRSIARMKELAPRIQNLKEQHQDDKQQLQQAMMALYREKKINPLGGCLPVLLQIPVFIALYWVILGSVELRHAPFYLWIDDLSAADPFFVLPLLMGGAMFLQTRMSPAPPDPTQAMILKIMPVFFTIFSLFFPSGLVLYWLVNTLLSITQQWHIGRTIARAGKGRN